MRVPEVWRGVGCFHSSDVGALAVTLLDWIKPGIFGVRDNKDELATEIWCIAKMMLLFPGWKDPSVENVEIKGWFKLASPISEAKNEKCPQYPGKPFRRTVPLEEELEKIDMPSELADLFRYLFIVDHVVKPSAALALRSPQLQRLA
jgi:hypothetical protein